MTQQPLVSIIIPTFNRADLIGETLDSVIAQTYQNWECIVVDDGSNDNTSEILKEYIQKDNRISYHHRPKNYKPGGNGARNYGFDMSKGEYINWFDSDDIMHPMKIEIQIGLLYLSNFNYSVCSAYVFEGNISNVISKRSEDIGSDNIFYDYLTQKIMIMTPSTLFEKKFLIDLKIRFNEVLKAAQEWEFYGRLLSKNTNFIATDKSLIYIRQHENSISYSEDGAKIRKLDYTIARKFVYTFLLNNSSNKEFQLEKEYLYLYIKKSMEDLIREKYFKTLNRVIFYNGINRYTLRIFFSIYFFVFTNRLKSRVKYV